MHIGRPFGAGDASDERSIMLSHSLWTDAFNSDPTVVGRSVFVDSQPHVVVGVTAREWSFPVRTP